MSSPMAQNTPKLQKACKTTLWQRATSKLHYCSPEYTDSPPSIPAVRPPNLRKQPRGKERKAREQAALTGRQQGEDPGPNRPAPSHHLRTKRAGKHTQARSVVQSVRRSSAPVSLMYVERSPDVFHPDVFKPRPPPLPLFPLRSRQRCTNTASTV